MRSRQLHKLAQKNTAMRKGALNRRHARLVRENARLKQNIMANQDINDVYTHIALSLARGYTDLYYVNIETDEFIEFHTDDEHGVLSEVRRGNDFFEGCKRDVKLFVHPDDEEAFVTAMDRDFLDAALNKEKVFSFVYRRIIDSDPFYVEMKVSRMENDKHIVVMAVADIDEQVKQRKLEERMIEERIVYARLHALTGNFICVYVVDPETDEYREFSSTAVYERDLGQAKSGTDFFTVVREAAKEFNFEDDLDRFLVSFTKENVMDAVMKNGIYTQSYRLMIEGKPTYVQMKAALVEEKEGTRLIVGLNDVDAQVRQEQETAQKLIEAQTKANVDALTGVKSKHAYLEIETLMDRQISEGTQDPFSVVICDVNDLKKVNDTQGHQAGDEHIRAACKIICDIFNHSPVFRTGGDEFVVISQGVDFDHVDDLMYRISEHNAQAARENGIVIASGMAKFKDDSCVAEVFERADQEMYADKHALKTALEEMLAAERGEVDFIDEDAARHDYLTGLLNMSSFLEHVERAKKDISGRGGSPVMLYADFSGMAFVNAKHGFAEGDRVLRSFARRLTRAFGKENSCRIGADHFAAISEEAGLETKLERIFNDFAKSCGGKTPPVHIGIYPYWVEDVPASPACDRAKLACDTLKGVYSSGFAYYNEKLREETLMRQHIIENFDRAMEEKWIQVYLQPIVRSVNQRVCDVEALARWDDPVHGMLSPATFIPVLEETGLVYKLDLYVLNQILEYIKIQDEVGITVPHSLNLSRSDFEMCDIVEEIRRRVDEAGISRDHITVEITESIIGADFDFMKEQIERFHDLGFKVWMDDFGSGYSSLDVLQTIKFDLIKFDMSFMQKFDESDDGKIVLTELMRMATSLGVETLCEGVETEEQVRFLQEIGCAKIQGYFFGKPVAWDVIWDKYQHGKLIPVENQKEAEYFSHLGKVNLYDLGIIANEEKDSVENTFNTLPMGIIEIKDREDGVTVCRWVRSNESYRQFIFNFFHYSLSELGSKYEPIQDEFMIHLQHAFRERNEERVFYDQRMPDGSIIHSFARMIDINPVTNTMAIVVAVLSIVKTDETSYADIARALSKDYYNIFLLDLDQDTYTEYTTITGAEELSFERHGSRFFESAKKDALTRIDSRDQQYFLEHFSKELVISEIDRSGVYTISYRLVDTGSPMYVTMKVSRLRDGEKGESGKLILGVSVIDAQMQEKAEAERLKNERAALGRIAALAQDYLVLYAVDANGHYTQYDPSQEFQNFNLEVEGTDFWADVVNDAPKAIPEEDLENHLSVMTKENVLNTIREEGAFVYNYRMKTDDGLMPANLKAVIVNEDGDETMILGVMPGHRA